MRPPLTGIGRYTLNLASHLAGILGPDALTLYLTREVRGLAGIRCRRVVAPVPTPHEALRAIWEQTFVPYAARRHRIDVYHSPNYTLPLGLPCPSVVTVHDLAFMDPHFHNRRLRIYLKLLTKSSLRRAAQVIAVSEYTKLELEQQFPFLSGRVSVVYSGLDPIFRKALAGIEHPSGERPYILFVGSIEPRKNLPRLIRAFERAMTSTGLPHELVLCGPWGWRYQPVTEALRRSPMRDRIRHVGYVPASKLPGLYAGADLLAYPSLDEGFGFPIIEAMSMGTPVITSDRAAPPEVAAGAAITAPPRDVNAIAAGIERVLTDRDLANDLSDRGRARAAEFTWERAAAGTFEVYRRAAGQGL
jgi:glycosyltransferase involved in cell wall biosynthesis